MPRKKEDRKKNPASKFSISNSSKDIIRSTLNKFTNRNYDTNNTKFQKAINADTKQAIATLYEVGYISQEPYMPEHNSTEQIKNYLNLETLDNQILFQVLFLSQLLCNHFH